MPESLFRSGTMHLYQLLLHHAAAYDCLSKLGDIGCVQFTDVSGISNGRKCKQLYHEIACASMQLNANIRSFQRPFVGEVRRCDEMERKLRFMYAEIKKEGIDTKRGVHDRAECADAPKPKEFNNLEVRSL